MKAPFWSFGGKSRIASLVWSRFGDVDNYVEPFFATGAVLLARPSVPKIETVNDLDGFIANFWRAIAADPEEVARHADWPVNEADLHARHLWLIRRRSGLTEALMEDPEFYDAKVAGWWCWGLNQWIGSGWCIADGAEKAPSRQLPHLSGAEGSHAVRKSKLPDVGQSHGKGVHKQLPQLRNDGMGVYSAGGRRLIPWFRQLAVRLRHVRVCCGDWKRLTGPSVTWRHGMTAVFLDPPYDTKVSEGTFEGAYAHAREGLSKEVREWAIEQGARRDMRIALCGYKGEHGMPDTWEEVAWKAHGGYGSQGDAEGRGRKNARRERVWFSSACRREFSRRKLF